MTRAPGTGRPAESTTRINALGSLGAVAIDKPTNAPAISSAPKITPGRWLGRRQLLSGIFVFSLQGRRDALPDLLHLLHVLLGTLIVFQ